MSVESLAARLDQLDATGSYISESERSVSVSNLTVEATLEIVRLSRSVGCQVSAFDGAGNEWSVDTLDEAFGPFRIELEKPSAPEGVLRLLTNVGFGAWLERDEPRSHWQVGRLNYSIETIGTFFTPWEQETTITIDKSQRRSPRLFVREFSGTRSVPASIDRWLLRDLGSFLFDGAATQVWVETAARKLMLSLPNEFESEYQTLRFKGPPRLELAYPASGETVADTLGHDGFLALQTVAAWIFEIERETEMRHILLATEIARCGGTDQGATIFLRKNLLVAHDGARTAYQVQLAGISSDALRTLAELRKSVTDETAKVADATRQIIAAVAGTLAVGVGLIAARLTSTASPFLIILVLVMAAAYVAITILSGVMFTALQRNVRKEWKPRLYRFLSSADYEALVAGPARTAERALFWSSALGAIAIVSMAIAIVLIQPSAPGKNASDLPNVSSGTPTPNGIKPTNVEQLSRPEQVNKNSTNRDGSLQIPETQSGRP